MNNLSFPASKNTEISFKVGIAGTSSPPSKVMVSLEQGTASLNFAAQQVGEAWSALIENPGKLFNGEIRFSINVLINNQLFTPYKCTATVTDVEEVTVPQDSVQISSAEELNGKVQPEPEIPVQQLQPVKTISITTLPSFEAKVEPSPVVQAKGLLKAVEQAVAGNVSESVKPQKPETVLKERAQTAIFSLRKTGIVYK